MTEQTTLPLAKIQGQFLTAFPQDLYVPPDALEIILEEFEGPLDLLLYLIRKQNLNIIEFSVAEITRQYLSYITMMKTLHIDLAAEYLVMAATLTEIKSRLLLPAPEISCEEEDPRADLLRRLQAYEQIKKAALTLDTLPQQQRDTFICFTQTGNLAATRPAPKLNLEELAFAYNEVLFRATLFAKHAIPPEPLSVREQMIRILNLINKNHFLDFTHLFLLKEGRLGVVVTFLAILELLKQSVIDIKQEKPYDTLTISIMSL
ncbi:MAG: hypothetical protein ACD_44C00366G0003 [uncultured bacterium]|nr:MAG: hypothetical protein ACD_44C00366G0003 [uncultured bacterium]OGT14903.1 MAG: hypothetical protein A3B69_02965 [Gammaproteobacteria bacterium RIFCSPHIGHO2_02_FULL_38_33]OGT24118.1 MAG: hypothetical protein A2W47_01075 [Gammaproteobacteria bacterium RIFCSPHIGHO2_12_38_15]OGT69206.1 MAG: hypothetical protein A3I12_03440 [Gammaproteobacteria bacterium RIFCSPLOWO2_02_FULL_38_11]OGT76524.1 MAG: hypothetical protein A3G71_07370 [Gammaproteobacteria bacterium RIFCSPLOWO2_12_FULL_38_14]